MRLGSVNTDYCHPLTHQTLEILTSFLGNLDDLECGGRMVSHDRHEGNDMFSNNRLEHNIPWLDHIRSHPASHRPHPYQREYLLRWGRNNNNLNRIKQHQGEADVMLKRQKMIMLDKQLNFLAVWYFSMFDCQSLFKLNRREIHFYHFSRFSSWIEQGLDFTIQQRREVV